jgi:PAS domain S-box-containing protein
MLEDKQGNLWICTMGGGLCMLDRKTEKFTRFNTSNSKIYTDYIPSVVQGDGDNLWLSTYSSVDKFNIRTKTFRNYFNIKTDTTSLSGLGVNLVFCDSKQHIWVGTDGGLNLYQPKTDNFRSFQMQDGLPDNSIKSITEDKHGNLWVGTNKGLSKFIGAVNLPKVAKFKNFTKEDGLLSNEFTRGASYTSSDGTIYCGTVNGFIRFHPARLMENKRAPDIYFTDFLLFNKPVAINEPGSPLTISISETRSVTLNHEQSVYTIKFVALNYIIPEKNQYAYILEGFETNWNYVGDKREATYTSLPPGTYTFRVKASNNDGVWNEKGIALKITILPPWYLTWWFKLLLIAILAGCVTFFVFRIVNKVKHLANQTILDERNQLKTLINNIPDQVFIKDKKCRFIVVNNKTIEQLGKKHEKEILNKTDLDFFPKEEASVFMQQETEIIKTGIPLMNVENTRLVNGKEEYFLQTKCPIINSKGETIGLLGIVRDITAQKKAELDLKRYNVLLEERNKYIGEQAEELKSQTEDLIEANALLVKKQELIQKQASELEQNNEQLSILNATKDKFFSIIAHDLRNPFNTVIGFSEILLQSFRRFPEEKIEKFLSFIHTSSISGNDLLSNLLMWSRSQSGTISFKPENLELSVIILETINLLEATAHQKGITLHKNFQTNIFCWFDENMMKTVIRNLVSNAIKFTPQDGKISISIEKSEKLITVSVSDTGVGIPKENLHKLFHIDSNFSTKGTSNESGTGLGLILCREFVEKHSGKIWVESEEGKGSTFRFTLPQP